MFLLNIHRNRLSYKYLKWAVSTFLVLRDTFLKVIWDPFMDSALSEGLKWGLLILLYFFFFAFLSFHCIFIGILAKIQSNKKI